jgi:hypothetical protein
MLISPNVRRFVLRWDCATIRYKDAENKCARRGSLKRCIRETACAGMALDGRNIGHGVESVYRIT